MGANSSPTSPICCKELPYKKTKLKCQKILPISKTSSSGKGKKTSIKIDRQIDSEPYPKSPLEFFKFNQNNKYLIKLHYRNQQGDSFDDTSNVSTLTKTVIFVIKNFFCKMKKSFQTKLKAATSVFIGEIHETSARYL